MRQNKHLRWLVSEQMSLTKAALAEHLTTPPADRAKVALAKLQKYENHYVVAALESNLSILTHQPL